MAKQVRQLQRDLLRANYEKDKLLAMKVAQLGGDADIGPADIAEEEEQKPEETAHALTSALTTFLSP